MASKYNGRATATRMASDVHNKLLAQAYIMAKSAGMQLHINKFDGVPQHACLLSATKPIVNVDVVNGVIKRSWAG